MVYANYGKLLYVYIAYIQHSDSIHFQLELIKLVLKKHKLKDFSSYQHLILTVKLGIQLFYLEQNKCEYVIKGKL